MNDRRTREPPSRRVERELRGRLARGEWTSGQRLPSVAAIAEQYGVARSTVSAAYARMDDVIEVVSHWGTFAR